MAQVHRFRDSVAVSLETGETVYLTVAESEAVARAMRKVSRDIKTRPYLESTVGTFNTSLSKPEETGSRRLPRDSQGVVIDG